jgi:phosphoribosyl-AMP cyclohydrolase
MIDEINFRIKRSGEDLAIAIAQDHETNEVLMVAFMNKEALKKTLKTGKMTYFSTSRKKLWTKGETSNHCQIVKEIRVDCDADALIFKVEQDSAACHEGYYSCFFRKLDGDELEITEKKVFDPEDVYK